MRKFAYITLGKILDELWLDASKKLPEEELWKTDSNGVRRKRYPITRSTFYRKENRLDLPHGWRTSGDKKWRVYSRKQADEIKHKIKKEFGYFDW